MTGFVVDCSVFLAWCLADEENPGANAVLHRLTDEGAVVPQIWWYELRNALLMNERRGRITAQQVADTLSDSTKLGIDIDADHDESAIMAIARQHRLTVYDSAYLEVASRHGLPLATLDRRLSEAATAAGIPLLTGAA